MNPLTAKKKKRFNYPILTVLLLFSLFTSLQLFTQAATSQEETVPAAEPAESTVHQDLSLAPAEIEKIESFVQKQMAMHHIPGISLVVVKEDQTVYQKQFGFANLEKREPVTATTLFELGSASKTFTALAILQLEAKGLLKLDDPVEKYLPWLKMKYRGQEVPITIRQFLHHSTGLPYYESLAVIPPSREDDALEKTVKSLVGWELLTPPGQKFTYTSIGYSVLGLIIQKVSGQSYEDYMKNQLFLPLHMNDTYLFRDKAKAHGMAIGYKLCFKKPSAYNAPVYRGNTPGAYIITNALDLAQWLKIQMGTVENETITGDLIEKSHVTAPDLGCPNYGAGWTVLPRYRLILHGGNNPNFSSYMAFGAEKVGVGLLANMGTFSTDGIGNGVLMILRGLEPHPAGYDMNVKFDNISTTVILALSFLILVALILLILSIVKIAGKKKRFSLAGTGRKVSLLIVTLIMAAWIYLITIIPSLLGFNVPLSFGFVWMPCSFALAILWIFLTGLLFYFFFLTVILFPKVKSGQGTK
jgi:putative ATP-binding cassette transporter